MVVGAVECGRGLACTSSISNMPSILSIAFSRCLLDRLHTHFVPHRLARSQVPALGWLIPRQRKALEVRQQGVEGRTKH